MAAVTLAVAGAVIAAGTLAHSVETANQGKRKAGQLKNEATAVADKQKLELDTQEAVVEQTKARDLARANQRRRVAAPSSAPTLMGSAGGGTLLGGPTITPATTTTIGG